MARQALAAGVGRPEQYVTVYSGMEVDSFLNSEVHREKVRKQFGFSERDVVIGAVARLFPLKGYEYILEAAPSIVRRCPQAKFLFVGDGILRQELQKKAEQHGLAQRIVFAGLVDSSRIPAMISAMDIVVHASLREGLARVLVQSLLCGKPPVAYDVDGNSEVIIDGVTGRLIPPRTVNELAQAVIGLIEDPRKAAEMGSAGRQRFAEQFRAETMVRQLEDLYRQLLAEKGVTSY
jgi:glycosyltransferase involved in cell wall biosynthesis